MAPGLTRMLWRAALRRCPWCGDRHAWFHSWLGKRERCQRCGLRWDRRTEGHELGAMLLNLILVMGILGVAVIVVMVLTYPEVSLLRIGLLFLGLSIVVPIITYPISFTVWTAIDLRVRPPQPAELADAAAAAAPSHPERSPAP